LVWKAGACPPEQSRRIAKEGKYTIICPLFKLRRMRNLAFL